jgi:hypothetical protein
MYHHHNTEQNHIISSTNKSLKMGPSNKLAHHITLEVIYPAGISLSGAYSLPVG